MPTKASIKALIDRATKQRETQIDGETLTISGTDYTAIVSAVEDPYGMEEAGRSGRKDLSATLRINQFLADPTTFDPAVDYTAQLPAHGTICTLRGISWFMHQPRTGHDSFRCTLKESKPRA